MGTDLFDRSLQLGDGLGAKAQYGIGGPADRVSGHDLRQIGHRGDNGLRIGTSTAEEFHEGLHHLLAGRRIHQDGEPADDALVEQPIHPAFDRRGRQTDLSPDGVEASAGILAQLRNDLLINGVHMQDCCRKSAQKPVFRRSSGPYRGLVTSIGSTEDRVAPSGVEGGYAPRHLLMCSPAHFNVVYDINPWMGETLRSPQPVDRARAERQWTSLVECYEALGHSVQMIEPQRNLPDMVFAANAATVIGGKVYTARYRYDQRKDEESCYRRWFREHGFTDIHTAQEVNEGEGDLLFLNGMILAGHGFRTDVRAHDEAGRFFDLPVLSLHLVDPHFYHLDTALAALGLDNIAWYPPAFAPESQAALRRLFPHAVVADASDAAVLGLNFWCDGQHVVMPAGARNLARELRQRGFDPLPVDLSELRKSGGSVKCCTLELRR